MKVLNKQKLERTPHTPESLSPIAKKYGVIAIVEATEETIEFAVREGENGQSMVYDPKVIPVAGFDIKKAGQTLVARIAKAKPKADDVEKKATIKREPKKKADGE